MTYEFPTDLIDLQRRFDAANRRCEELAATHPKAVDIVAGTAQLTEEQAAVYAAAWAERAKLVLGLHRHPWWLEVGDRREAKEALRAAARGE